MLVAAIIAFREFLEAFLLTGTFVGIDRKLKLGRLKEILLATTVGIIVSLALPIIVFFFAKDASYMLTEKNANVLEGYLLTFSGFFLAYVIFALHKLFANKKLKQINTSSAKLEKRIFDASLFFAIVFFIAREGFEIALLVAATSLFSTFLSNLEGLFLGFLAALCVGLITFFTYVKLPIKKIFIYTEDVILVVGAAMVKNGISYLLESYAHMHLENFIPLPLHFLPGEESIPGHLLINLTGLQPNLSLVQVGIMTVYIVIILAVVKRIQLSAEK